MAAPRLRNKLVAAATSTEDENKPTGQKADGAPEGETDEERKKREEEEEKEASAKAARAADPVAADRARTKAITSSANGKHFPALASHLAYDAAVSAEAAEAVFAAILQDVDVTASAAAPAAGAASPRGDAFRRAMASEAPNPSLGTGTGSGAEKSRLMSFSEIRAARADAKRK